MIHVLSVERDESVWQTILRSSVRSAKELQHSLELEDDQVDWVASPKFPLQVPRTFINRMEKRNANDPLLLQVAPSRQESHSSPQYTSDPLHEKEFGVQGGVIQKYANRVLLITTPACPVHCRYCFRRNFDYGAHQLGETWNALDTIAKDQSIVEVILSGGDPLTLKNDKINGLMRHLSKIPHVRTLRIHTRFPVMIPQRITPALIEILSDTRLKVVVVVHINHPNEIDHHVRTGIQLLRQAQIDVFNQSVLLKGVNDSVETLSRLMHRVFEIGVIPYYLHLFDRVSGAQHFDTADSAALVLWKQLQIQLPGYLVPKLVREVPFESAKTIVA